MADQKISPHMPAMFDGMTQAESLIADLEDLKAAPGVSLANFERISDAIADVRKCHALLASFADVLVDEPDMSLDDLKTRFRDRGRALIDRYVAGLRAA